ncbi:MAG: fructose-6-phosphate aldolase [Bacteroidota bacterium]|nr:fructose-6-phosphate aldolase [Bacteroidota bacterium]|tara:strand:- start:2306 stop:2512 length:207 start_codon:yes stop_codon:yes gene_type:complete
MYIIKIKGKAKIPDYIQLRNKDMVLVDYFRADRPIDKLRNYKIKSPDNQIIKYINSLPFGKLEPLNIS